MNIICPSEKSAMRRAKTIDRNHEGCCRAADTQCLNSISKVMSNEMLSFIFYHFSPDISERSVGIVLSKKTSHTQYFTLI